MGLGKPFPRSNSLDSLLAMELWDAFLGIVIFLKKIYSFLFERQREESERELAVGLLLKWLQHPGIVHTTARSVKTVSISYALGTSAAFSSGLTESCIRGGATGAWTNALMGCWHCRWLLNMLDDNTGLETAIEISDFSSKKITFIDLSKELREIS